MKMLRWNFINALAIAVTVRIKEEDRAGFKKDSAFLAGMKEAMCAAERGEEIIIEEVEPKP